ncbi:hypothetical protein [Marinivivus vitaminiproducens]|uniref:hypothetical protein n=1 Tax=Marinivivus vitaminiproducens TaxID=3035935 RepID=UPI002798DD7A|nr:hypothetical protein P4R82_24155 [Geminicoccaceae bacterium SCSIO 64248]
MPSLPFTRPLMTVCAGLLWSRIFMTLAELVPLTGLAGTAVTIWLVVHGVLQAGVQSRMLPGQWLEERPALDRALIFNALGGAAVMYGVRFPPGHGWYILAGLCFLVMLVLALQEVCE